MTATPREIDIRLERMEISQSDLARWRRFERKRRRQEASRRRVMVFLAALVGLLVGATIARAGSSRESGSRSVAPVILKVQSGDTVIGLARRHAEPGETVSDARARLSELNGGDLGVLVPGQMIRVR
jgi:hypothetical protein